MKTNNLYKTLSLLISIVMTAHKAFQSTIKENDPSISFGAKNKKMKLTLNLFFLLLLSLSTTAQKLDSIKVFDNKGNLIEIGFVEDGKLKNLKEHYEYDSQGRLLKEYVTDTLAQIQARIGLAEILTYEYLDADDCTTKIIKHFDQQMNPTYNDMAFFHRLDLKTNAIGQELERKYYKTDGQLIEWIKTEYNTEGLAVKIEYLNDDGSLSNRGVAFTEIEYDSLNRVIAERNYASDASRFSSDERPFLKTIAYIKQLECTKYYDNELNEIKMARTTMCDPIPDFGAFNSKGEKVKISQLKTKFVIIHFWSTVFRAGDSQLSAILELKNNYKDQGVEVFSVAVEQNDTKWWNVSQEKGVDWNYNLYDDRFQKSEVIQQFYPSYLPMTYIINQEGLMLGHHISRVEEVEDVLRQILNE